MREIDPYETLAISDTATPAQIRSAVSRCMLEYWSAPNLPGAYARFGDVHAAYEILIANEARGVTDLMRGVYRLKRASLHVEKWKASQAISAPLSKPATWMDVAEWLSEGRSEPAKFILGFAASALDYAAGMRRPD